jgi:outer membrane receptor protein involved in Fe transport
MHHPGSLLAALLLLISLALESVAAPDPVVIAQATDPSAAAEPDDAVGASDPEPQSAPAAARGGIEEIVVQGGESDAVADLEASDSVTGFDASDLEALGAQSVEDLAAFTPNLEIVSSGATTPTFFIRGVGLNDFNANSSGAVAIFQDDVVKNAPALQLQTLYDMEAVNIMRGPQGTGAARNASAGAIKLYSRKPSGGFGGFFRSSFGNYSAKDFEGAIEAPIWEDMLSARFAFRFSERDGVRKNRCGGGGSPPAGSNPTDQCGITDLGTPLTQDRFTQSSLDRVNDQGTWSARGALRFQPTLDMDWLLTAQGSRRDELSQLGESYGTVARVFVPGCADDVPPGRRPPECKIRGALGGTDRLGYRAVEVEQMLAAADPCKDFNGVQAVDNGTCGFNPADPFEQANSASNAQLDVGNQLVDLDTRPWEGSYNRTGPTTNDVWNVALKGDIALGRSLFLTTVSGYDTYDRLTDVDLDFSPNQLFEVVTDDEGWQFYQDLQLAGSLQDTPFNWRVGGYFLKETLDVSIENFFTPIATGLGITNREYTQKLMSSAGWVSMDWTFWNDFTLDGGARYNWEKKDIDFLLLTSGAPVNQAENRTWSAPTGTVRLTYRFREDTHAYWKYTRGWKGGHFNATTNNLRVFGPEDLPTPPGQTPDPTRGRKQGVTVAEPETIDAFEGGIRGSWLQGRLGLDLSVFYYNYQNYQIFVAQESFLGDPNFLILNANDAEVYGAEADIVARPFPGSFLQLRFSWLQSQFLDFVQLQQTAELVEIPNPPPGTIPFASEVFDIEIQSTGNPLLNSPKFKVSLTAEQTIPLGRFGSLTPRYDGAWTATTFFDATAGKGVPNGQGEQFLPDDTIAQPAYFLHNLRLGYRVPDGSIELAGWIRNIANKAAKTFAFDGSGFNKTTIYFVGEPRTFGLSLSASF